MKLFLQVLPSLTVGEDVCRLFHGRGGLFAGDEHLCLDWYKPVLLLTSFKMLDDEQRDELVSAIVAFWQSTYPNQPLNLVYQ